MAPASATGTLDVFAGSRRIKYSRASSADWRTTMAIMSLHWIWHLIGSQRRSVAWPKRRVPLLMKIEVEHLPDYRWRDLGFLPARRSDETDHGR